jgi:amidase
MVLAYGLRGNISMASHDSACGPNVLPLNRREVLTLTGAASAVATTQAFTNAASAAAEHTPHIVMADALALADTIRSRQVSCVEVMTNYLGHIEKINPKVNAIVALQDRAGLLAQASGRDARRVPERLRIVSFSSLF